MRTKIHTILSLAVAFALWTSCSDKLEFGEDPRRAIGFSCETVIQRAQEATAANMTSFRVSAVWAKAANDYVDGYMDGQLVEKNESGVWTYSPVKYMPADGSVDFFAYSPANAPVSGFSISGSTHDRVSLMYDVTTDPVVQHDFMVGEALEQTGSSVFLNFRHALSSIRVEAQSVMPNFSFRVREVKLINLYRQGTLTGVTSSGPNKTTTWAWGEQSIKTTYTFKQNGPIDISENVVLISDPTSPLMILPQVAEKGSTTVDPDNIGSGTYLAVTYDLLDDSLTPILEHSVTDYIPLADPLYPANDFSFEMNKKYVFRINLKYPPARSSSLLHPSSRPVLSLYIDTENE